MAEVVTPEECQQKLDDNVNTVLLLLNGMNTDYAKIVLEASISQIQQNSYVQFEKSLQK
jgi:hypothetical protein